MHEAPNREKKKGMDRRAFMQGAGYFSLTVAAGALFFNRELFRNYQYIVNLVGDPQYSDNEAIEHAREFIESTYGIQALNGEPFSTYVSGAKLEEHELRDALAITIGELAKYPPDFFKRNHISAINYVKDLVYYEKREKNHLGVALASTGTIVLEYTERKFVQQTLHHEVVHIADFHEAEELDHEWYALHKQCDCGVYGDNVPPNERVDNEKYFLDRRAQENPAESRAQLGEYMMMPLRHEVLLVDRMRKKDKPAELLREKYADMKANYLRWSGGKMDDAFWERLIASADQHTDHADA